MHRNKHVQTQRAATTRMTEARNKHPTIALKHSHNFTSQAIRNHHKHTIINNTPTKITPNIYETMLLNQTRKVNVFCFLLKQNTPNPKPTNGLLENCHTEPTNIKNAAWNASTPDDQKCFSKIWWTWYKNKFVVVQLCSS